MAGRRDGSQERASVVVQPSDYRLLSCQKSRLQLYRALIDSAALGFHSRPEPVRAVALRFLSGCLDFAHSANVARQIGHGRSSRSEHPRGDA